MPEIIDPEPVVIDSIQFLEVDTLFNVINQDPAYVLGQNFVNGDIFNYTSISDTAWARNEKFPGGINMVLRGKNAAGERVRNVFTVTYTNECGVPTFDVGDAIGWVVIVSGSSSSLRVVWHHVIEQCLSLISHLTMLSHSPPSN